ncbi:MAG: methyltransferase domain-containing protein [Bacteroidota bacterium]
MSSELAYLTPPHNDFEEAYLSARHKEGRVYADEIVRQLPIVPKGHPQEKEWGLRTRNVQRLIQHLKAVNHKRILDLGCGNGWLTHQLVAEQDNKSVLGLDVNEVELEQAQRLFASSNCRFAYGDIFKAELAIASYDSIILASCAQYFSDFPALLSRLLALLSPGGEIHVFDTPFYSASELVAAQERTSAYYQQQGESAMQQHYFHRTWAELQVYQYEIKYDPSSLPNRLKRKLGSAVSPFPWLLIRNTTS